MRRHAPALRPRSIAYVGGERDGAVLADETRDLAERAAHNILVNTVCIGLIKSGQHEKRWAQGNAADRNFYNQLLGADYVADDAATYAFVGAAGGIFADIPIGTFDDGTQGTYDVDYPDVLAPIDANSTVCMLYLGGSVAGIQRVVGNSRVVHLGFPLETIVNPDIRARVMSRALRFLLDGRALEAPATVAQSSTAPIESRRASSTT